MADTSKYDLKNIDIAWCPGCGNFQILSTIKKVLAEMDIDPSEAAWSTGIGQAAKIPQYFKTNYFNGLHGRSLPVATAIKAANPNLEVFAESGDGCTYGEGGNHFIHTIRRNPDITNLVHDNRIYGLTKGQASPTTDKGMITTMQFNGVSFEPFNPIGIGVASNASFVARAYSADQKETKEIIKAGIEHDGYALIDLLHPCVSFNKKNTYKWYKEHTYYLDEEYDPYDQEAAFQKSQEREQISLGIIFKNDDKAPFEDTLSAHNKGEKYTPLYERDQKFDVVKDIIEQKRVK